MKALWAPLEVTDFDTSQRFYGTMLGLRRIHSWQGPGERGAIYEAGAGGRIEVVATDQPQAPPPIALEMPTWHVVDDLHDRLAHADAEVAGVGAADPASAGQPSAVTARPRVFPRGHYGFVAHDPDGNTLLIWSEA